MEREKRLSGKTASFFLTGRRRNFDIDVLRLAFSPAEEPAVIKCAGDQCDDDNERDGPDKIIPCAIFLIHIATLQLYRRLFTYYAVAGSK
jgi:hypothetical protein